MLSEQAKALKLEYNRAWRKKNKEKIREYNKQYYKENKEKIVNNNNDYWNRKAQEQRGYSNEV